MYPREKSSRRIRMSSFYRILSHGCVAWWLNLGRLDLVSQTFAELLDRPYLVVLAVNVCNLPVVEMCFVEAVSDMNGLGIDAVVELQVDEVQNIEGQKILCL